MSIQAAIEGALKRIAKQQQQIQRCYHQLELSDDRLYIPGINGDKGFLIHHIQAITKVGRQVEVWDRFGHQFLSDTTLNLGLLQKRLTCYPQFLRSHDSYIINLNHLDYFEPSPTDRRGRVIVFQNTGFKAAISGGNVDDVKKYFLLGSLEHVEPWDERYQAILDENLRHFDKKIKEMSKEELLENFSYQTTDEFNIREFMANAIWEYYHLILAGIVGPIEGNIRTFWYVLKPILAIVVTIHSDSQYGIMLDVFKELIVKHKLFKFKDFGFVDAGEHYNSVGSSHPNIIFVAEKTGHYRKLQRIQEEFGVSIISLGGMPSILTTEYFVDKLEKVLDVYNTPFHLITLVDYDPSGAIIYSSFYEQLKHEGIKNIASNQHLLIPAHFSQEELKRITEPVPMKTKADRTKTQKWLEQGGGVDGQPLGIESEALILDFDRMRKLFKEAFEAINGPLRTNIPVVYQPYIDLTHLKIDWKLIT